MPKTPILLAVLALVLVAACDDAPGDKADGDGEEQEAKGSFAHATSGELSGTFFYIGPKGDDAVAVYAFTDGKKPREVLTGDSNLWASATPSPDGRYISHVDADAKLRIWDVEAGRQLDLPDTPADGICREPAWTPDSKGLLVHGSGAESEPEANLVAVPSGKTSDAETIDGCHPRLTATDSGEHALSYMTGDVKSLVLQDGDAVAKIPTDVVEGRVIIDPVSAARDNAALCVATAGPDDPVGDAARSLGCDTVIDTETRKPAKTTGDISGAFFPESGGFVTRTRDGELSLSDSDKADIATVTEPAELSESFLIGYTEPR